MEINFLHGDPLNLADRVFLFKRTVREAALRHHMYATFMAKPMEGEPGSRHARAPKPRRRGNRPQSVYRPRRRTDRAVHRYIAGLQKYTPALMPIFAPYINSYRRLSRFMAAPINVAMGLRQPHRRFSHSALGAGRAAH